MKTIAINSIFLLFACWLFIAKAEANDIIVHDFNQREVRLFQPAKRIIALAPHIVENIFSAGAGDLIVGAIANPDYPEAAKSIASVGDIQGLSVEKIIALEPDLVIVWSSGISTALTRKLTTLGIPVYFDEPRHLTDIAKSIRDIGILTQRSARAEQIAGDYLTALNKLRRRYLSRKPVSVFYQVWNKPLQTINGEHIISAVIGLCGGRNIFADEPVIAPKISIESVIKHNPQVIIASGMDQQRPGGLDDWLQWPSITAVDKQQLYFIHPDIIQRHTVRLLQGAEQMCTQLDNVRTKEHL